jgi:predicted nucleic acid-binding protein
MILLDTDVMIDVLRAYAPALKWLDNLGNAPVGLPGLVALELIQGCRNREEQRRVEKSLQNYKLFWPTAADSNRALHDFLRVHLKSGIGMIDTLIAATAIGLDVPLATFNARHYRMIRTLNARRVSSGVSGGVVAILT